MAFSYLYFNAEDKKYEESAGFSLQYKPEFKDTFFFLQ
jgi:hypothetical protein